MTYAKEFAGGMTGRHRLRVPQLSERGGHDAGRDDPGPFEMRAVRDLSASNSSSSCVVRFCASSIRLVGQARRPSSWSRQREIDTRVSHDLLCIYRPLGRNLSAKVVPLPARLEAVTTPPWRSTMALTIDSPRPLPVARPARADRPCRTDRRRAADAPARCPDPVSLTVTTTPSSSYAASARCARLSAYGAARWPRGSAAPARAASDRRRRFRRPARCSS